TDPLGMNALRLWDASTGAPGLTIADLGQTSVAFSPDGLGLAAAGRCCSWSIAARGVADGSLLPVPSGNPVPGLQPVAFPPDGQTLAAGLTPSLSSETGTSIVILRIADGTAVGSPFVGHTGYVVALAYSPDGAGLASGSSDSTLRFWRVADGAPLKTYDEE